MWSLFFSLWLLLLLQEFKLNGLLLSHMLCMTHNYYSYEIYHYNLDPLCRLCVYLRMNIIIVQVKSSKFNSILILLCYSIFRLSIIYIIILINTFRYLIAVYSILFMMIYVAINSNLLTFR